VLAERDPTVHDGLVQLVAIRFGPGCRPRLHRRAGCKPQRVRRHRDASDLASPDLVDRYYDPATGQFLTVDPLVDETGQAYAYTGDDPVNGTDPLGLYFGQGFLDSARHDVASVYDSANSFVNNEVQTIDCNAIGGGNSIFNGILGCAGDQNSDACPLGALSGTFNPANLVKVKPSYLKSYKIDAEAEKAEIYGDHGAQYDIYRDSATGELFAGPKSPTASSDYQPLNIRIWNNQKTYQIPDTNPGEDFEGGFDG
jgi:RHS repeat-associated protein